MSYVETLGEKLARDVLAAQRDTGDLDMVQNIGQVLEASSSTLHEAFMTAVRVYDAEERARKALAQMLQSHPPR